MGESDGQLMTDSKKITLLCTDDDGSVTVHPAVWRSLRAFQHRGHRAKPDAPDLLERRLNELQGTKDVEQEGEASSHAVGRSGRR